MERKKKVEYSINSKEEGKVSSTRSSEIHEPEGIPQRQKK